MKKPVAEFWYAIDSCNDRILRLREAWIDPFLGGNLWLVRGSERDALVDTGTGILSPRPVVDAIVDKPLIAVACNCFYDHAGGLHAFDERGCHRLDADRVESPTFESSVVSTYVSDEMLIALPYSGYQAATYRMQGAAPTLRFDEGDRIDLGDRFLEVLHVPGVTQGSMALWEARTGSLFTCDTLFDDPLRERAEREKSGEESAVYSASLTRLCELPVVTVYPGHFRTFGRDRMIELVDEIRRR